MYLSVIIPAYNEEKRIGPTLSKIDDFLSSKKYDYEVIVVDDGSLDGTVSEVKKSELAKEGGLILIKNGANKGKGFSVKRGILESRGEFVLFSDADLSTPIEELDKLFDCLNRGYDAAIGSRSIKGSDIRTRQPWYREMMGKVFNLLVRLFLIKGFNDTQCGFKLLKGSVARATASMLTVDGFSFDVEMLYLAKAKGYKIKEVGVAWSDSAESRVRIIGSSLDMFLDLFRIKSRRLF